VIVFLQSSESGGIKLWKNSQQLFEGNQFGVNNFQKIWHGIWNRLIQLWLIP
jgi:hypothetical protein